MSIGIPTVKVLWSRAHDQCAFPGCRQALTAESVDAKTGEVRTNPVGEQAHIRSHRPDGPRFDPDYPRTKLHLYENLILLCPTHHARVDANSGAEFTVENLLAMRETHEAQTQRREEIDKTLHLYTAQQFGTDDKVLFEQVDLNGPSVDSMFVDVPFSCRPDVRVAEFMQRIAEVSPGDVLADDNVDGQIVTGAAQALLHPDWQGNALLVGGPGQGKSTLLQYVCQYYRARLLDEQKYTGQEQRIGSLTTVQRVPIRLDLRKYALWATTGAQHDHGADRKGKRKGKSRKSADRRWPTIEEYIATEVTRNSGGRTFSVEDVGTLVSTRPVLIALDGLDEVANLEHREAVSVQIADTQLRLDVDAVDLVVLVASRPGGTTSALWSSAKFPRLTLQRLTHGLRLQYLQRWAEVANLTQSATDKLQRTFMENQNVPHIRELASYPMQLAILLHLLHRRQLLPQRRTELYSEYLMTFLDREQNEDKEPLLAEERQVVEDIHAYIGWYIHTQAEEGKSSGSIQRDDLKRLLRQHLEGRADGQKLAEKLFSAFTTRVLCLVERDPGSFQFDVQSLREYFAALYIFEETDRDVRDDCLIALLKRPYWSNVCRFLVGKYSRGEVRGMRSVLQDLSKDKKLGLHPTLRSTAALFLNDRTYEGQKEEPIQEVVDFILDGPGVVLAEDGLLDTAGAGLQLSERAGRIQAVRHLKSRLESEPDPEIRRAAASSLRRHATADGDLKSWWWDRYDGAGPWLDSASQLGVLGGLTAEDDARLVQCLTEHQCDSTWTTELLIAGGYDGTSDDVLNIVKREANDGAIESLHRVGYPTSIARILRGASVAVFGSSGTARVTSPARLRGTGEASTLSTIVEATQELLQWSASTATERDWHHRLGGVAAVWGDGWVLRQAVAAIPAGISLNTTALLAEENHPELHTCLTIEAQRRDHRRDVDWWREQLASADNEFARRIWILSVLTRTYSPVIIALANELSSIVDALAPKHYIALRDAIQSAHHTNPSISRELVLHDPLRLHQVTFSARTLWLLRAGATQATAEQIGKQIPGALGELLMTRIGDLRELTRLAGTTKTIKFEAFRGHRATLPAGGWASNVKLGALRSKLAEEVLAEPQEWPADLVQRAVEKVEETILSGLAPVSQIALSDKWFEN